MQGHTIVMISLLRYFKRLDAYSIYRGNLPVTDENEAYSSPQTRKRGIEYASQVRILEGS